MQNRGMTLNRIAVSQLSRIQFVWTDSRFARNVSSFVRGLKNEKYNRHVLCDFVLLCLQSCLFGTCKLLHPLNFQFRRRDFQSGRTDIGRIDDSATTTGHLQIINRISLQVNTPYKVKIDRSFISLQGSTANEFNRLSTLSARKREAGARHSEFL